jgi:N-acetylglucosaminyldiphosphoundecaprenol N-acetyl-beta-D-mannosaminyltransferase
LKLEVGNGSGLGPNRRIDVLGVGISALDLPTAVGAIEQWIAAGAREYVCITGVHGVMESQADEELRNIHNRSGMTTPDGMPMVWCGHYAGVKSMERVYGPDLMLEVCRAAVATGWKMYFYGAADGVPESLAERLSELYPGLTIAGTFSPPFRELTADEEREFAKMINASGADIVWVGLSTPKQERWMNRMRPLLDAAVLVGVGAAFDIHAGRLPQAPRWMQRSGLEWLYRLVREPRRLARRYLSNNPRFVVKIVRNRPHEVTVVRSAGSLGG